MYIIVAKLEGTSYVNHKIVEDDYKLVKHERIVAKGTAKTRR
jgi:hypothetical protein